MKFLKRTLISFVISSLLITASALAAEKSLLDTISERGYLLVGTTGDYKPFSYLNPETKAYEGHDIDAARKLGEALGVETRFVATTWKTLTRGLLEGKYDVAMCGITRTLSRQKVVGLTASYIRVGKSPLIRKADKERFKTLADIDQAGVKIGVNPGGTNEKFVRANIRQAEIIVVPKNLDIPGKVAAGEADVMITDNVEAMLVAAHRPELYAVAPRDTFTKDDFGYMVPRDDPAFLNWMNLWIHQMMEKGEFQALKEKWIGK
ncbi:cyclohexadienyl dehydratase [Desulfonema ishimotonii]|uniref:Cyclohexadienyl dehydratase n=1 Tax=Desulfonema ishimotonii TaxID=45657 RepID=A0A401G1F7_9BACT|nr:transporter substrate-binding domain-containing protein [Desulfonema ishimotonii]GBC63023.1 cyclohexadienyl dehydratase [Desulfonema ishimotonii]